MTQAAARAMISASRGGRIVNFSSGVSTRGSHAAAYASSPPPRPSPASLRSSGPAQHPLSNCVSPGLIDTSRNRSPSMAQSLSHRIPQLPLAPPASRPRSPSSSSGSARPAPATSPAACTTWTAARTSAAAPPRPGRRRGRPLRLGHRPHPLTPPVTKSPLWRPLCSLAARALNPQRTRNLGVRTASGLPHLQGQRPSTAATPAAAWASPGMVRRPPARQAGCLARALGQRPGWQQCPPGSRPGSAPGGLGRRPGPRPRGRIPKAAISR
jgi:hypothetical protein